MKLSHIFKVILLLLLPLFVLAQYPNNPVKSRLGWQTTGDGLVYRGAGAPAYSPGTMFNAWMYLDTTNFVLYGYIGFQWQRLPLVNNGLNADGAYHQLGGTLVENTTVERSTYTLDFGKKSGANNGWISLYGTDPHYVGILTTKDGTESGLTMGNKLWGFEVDDSDHVSTFTGSRFGFDATYLGTLGVSQFKMDSTRFYIRGLPTYATHAAADADLDTYGMYQITDGRAIYARTGSADKVSPNIQDNGTAVSILNSKPFQLGQWTTAGRPSGVTGYEGYNTTGNGKEWYQGSRWAYAWESTLPTFTTGSVIFANANGQANQDNANFFWDDTNNRLGLGTASPISNYILDARGSGRFTGTEFRAANNGVQFTNTGSGAADYVFTNAASSGNTNIYVTSAGAGTSSAIFFRPNAVTVGQFTASSSEFIIQHLSSNVRILGASSGSPTEIRASTNGVNISTAGGGANASYTLDVTGTNAIRISRGTTAQTPTEVVGILRYNSDTVAYQGYAGSARIYFADRTWVRSTLTTSLGNYWNTAGNTSGSSKFLGTTDASPLNLRTNNRERLVVSSGGAISINTTSTTAKLNLVDTTSSASIGVQSANYVTFTSNNAGSVFGSSNNINLRGAFTYNASGGLTSGVDGNSYNGTIFHDGTGLAGTLINFRGGIRTTSTGNVTNAITLYSAIRNATDTIENHYALYYGGYDATTTGRVLHSYVVYGGENGATFNHIDPWGVYIPNPSQKNLFGGLMTFSLYGTPATTAAALSKTLTNYGVGFATDGTVTSREIKRDTTIYVDDADCDWSAAITTAQIASRFNRVIFWMTTTTGASSDSELTLHTPDANLMQVEYIVHSVDEGGSYDNEINFGTNNAVNSANSLATGYLLAAGQGLHVRAGLRSAVYKYRYY